MASLRTQGRYETKLIIERCSQTMSEGGLENTLYRITCKGLLVQHMKNAKAWVAEAIDMIIAAPDNKFGTDREAIAKWVLDELVKAKAIRKVEQ